MNDSIIRLREMKPEDGPFIVEWRNASRRFFFNEDPISLEGHLKFMEKCDEPYFIIERMGDSKPVGAISLYDISHRHKRAEYGRFLIAPEERRKGYGERALKLLLQFAFQDLKLIKVYGDILAHNTAAIKLDQKLGFFKEAHLVKHVLKGERLYDVMRLTMFKEMLHG